MKYPKEATMKWGATPQELVRKITPPLGAENFHPLFKKYGATYSGIGVGWIWDEELLKTAPDEDLWIMIGLTNQYWLNFYDCNNAIRFWNEYKEKVKGWILKNERFKETLEAIEKAEEEAKKGGYYRGKGENNGRLFKL